jgi:hypothetical protein
MTDSQQRAAQYRKLFVRNHDIEARNLIDSLQVLALTRPETLRELETFLDRGKARNPPPSDEARDPGACPRGL